MTTTLKAALLAAVTSLGISHAADAATVASVDVAWGKAGTLIHEIDQAGDYTLDFTGKGKLWFNPNYLGKAAYVFAEVNDGLDDLLGTLGGGVKWDVMKDSSVDLGYLALGIDFIAGIWALGGPVTMSLNVEDSPAPAPVPLPATLPLLAAAMGAAGLVARRRKDA